MSLHMNFLQISLFLESQTGKKFTGNVLHVQHIYIRNSNPSNWCQHWYPWHWIRWSRAFMQRAWHLCLCLGHWCCCLLMEGAVVHFSGWGWLLFIWCCCCPWCTRHAKNHGSWIRAPMQEHENFCFHLDCWHCCVLVKKGCIEFFCWAWLFVVCCCCHFYWYHWDESYHALLIILIPNHCYISPNSLHTWYTP